MFRHILSNGGVVIITLLFATSAPASIITVSNDLPVGDVPADNIDPDEAFQQSNVHQSIQEAIESADWGDVIQIEAGTYAGL